MESCENVPQIVLEAIGYKQLCLQFLLNVRKILCLFSLLE